MPLPLLDFRPALRALRRSPAFALAGIGTLALATGAVTSVLAVVSTVLLKPLPVRDEGEIVVAWKRDLASGFEHWPFTYPAAHAIQRQLTTVAASATIDYNGAYPLSVVESDRGVTLPTGLISGDLMPLLDVRPIVGRVIRPSDDVVGAPRVAVISEGYWRQRYGADPGSVGRTFRMYGESYTLVGVIRSGFGLPSGAEMWIAQKPFQPHLVDSEVDALADLVVRLKPGVTLEAFRSEVEAIRGRLPDETIKAYQAHQVVAVPLRDFVVGQSRPTLLLLAAGVALLLIVAAANLGGLFLVRSGQRLHEIAIRTAIGGGRAQSVGGLTTELLLVAVVGIALGIPVGAGLLRLLRPLLPPELPIQGGLRLEPLAVVLAAGAAALAAGLGSLAPVFALSRANLMSALRGDGRGSASGWGMHPIRRVMVGAQMALAMTILTGAGLLIRTLEGIEHIAPGFRPAGVLFIDLATSGRYDTVTTSKRERVDRMLARFRAVPGVISAAAVLYPPFIGNAGFYAKLVPPGRGEADAARLPYTYTEVVSPGIRGTLGLDLRRGRFFESSDREGAPTAVVVNETLARITWPGEDPIGKVVHFPSNDTAAVATVVGVAGDTRYNEWLRPVPMAYFGYRQLPWVPENYLIRTGSDEAASALVPSLRAAVQDVEPAMALQRALPLSTFLDQPLARPRLAAVLVSVFALGALLLAAIGIYGVMASFVVQRTREIGVRMALGATGTRVRSLVFRQGMRVAVVGLGVGLLVALGAGRLLAGMLYGVTPADALTFLLATAVLLAAAGLAVMVPARRASRLDPMAALRAE
jgi:putative ABC transport system permease protein